MPGWITFQIEERGAVPRRFKTVQRTASLAAWQAVGEMFHATMRDARFSSEHGRKAGYALRRGEEPGIGSKAFWKSYTGRKLKKWHHKRPLEFSGATRRNVKAARVKPYATEYGVFGPGRKGGGVQVFYNAPTFNLRPKGGQIHMREEFTRLLQSEVTTLAREYERVYVSTWNADSRTENRQI